MSNQLQNKLVFIWTSSKPIIDLSKPFTAMSILFISIQTCSENQMLQNAKLDANHLPPLTWGGANTVTVFAFTCVLHSRVYCSMVVRCTHTHKLKFTCRSQAHQFWNNEINWAWFWNRQKRFIISLLKVDKVYLQLLHCKSFAALALQDEDYILFILPEQSDKQTGTGILPFKLL